MKYDAFISYSHQNATEALHLVELLQEHRPTLKIFLDRKEPGLFSSKKVAA